MEYDSLYAMQVLQQNSKAFKEWAVVVDALASGRQIVLFRKGGIDEGIGGFEVEEKEFFLFPTYEHQNREELIPDVHGRLAKLSQSQPRDGKIHISSYARVEDVRKITDLAILLRLAGHHIWTQNLVEERFNWGKGKFLFAMLLKVFRLQHEVVVSNRVEFGGCKSWVDLEENFSTEGAPVLSEPEFCQKVNTLQKLLS